VFWLVKAVLRLLWTVRQSCPVQRTQMNGNHAETGGMRCGLRGYPESLREAPERFPDNGAFTTDDTDVHRLRTFGSTLMPFLIICAIRFICVICGSLVAEAGGMRCGSAKTVIEAGRAARVQACTALCLGVVRCGGFKPQMARAYHESRWFFNRTNSEIYRTLS
jgi:hypothetical protein